MVKIHYTVFYSPDLDKTLVPAFNLEIDGNDSWSIVSKRVYEEILRYAFMGKTLPDDNVKNLNLPASYIYNFKKRDSIQFNMGPVYSKTGIGESAKLSKEHAIKAAKSHARSCIDKFTQLEDLDYTAAANTVIALENLFSEIGYKLSDIKKELASTKKVEGVCKKSRLSLPDISYDLPYFHSVKIYSLKAGYIKVVCTTEDMEEISYLYSMDEKYPPFLIPCDKDIPHTSMFYVGNWVKFLTKGGVSPLIVTDADIVKDFLDKIP